MLQPYLRAHVVKKVWNRLWSSLYLCYLSRLFCLCILIVPEVTVILVCLSIFLAGLMSADIVLHLWSLVCSCLNSYITFHLFSILIMFQIGCFLHWIKSVDLIFVSSPRKVMVLFLSWDRCFKLKSFFWKKNLLTEDSIFSSNPEVILSNIVLQNRIHN